MAKHTCAKCGATLPAADRPCLRCLMELAARPGSKAEDAPLATGARKSTAPPPRPEELAALFPELEIEALLGAGGMGAVYRARQKRLGRDVALKILHGELSDDQVFVERFLREAQALAKLAHPGIVAVHDFGERERRCYLVMEYVDGTNLRALLKAGTLVPRQSLDVVRQLCDALQFAHDEGVVHRDIKPENVLVDRSGRVKIADFGLAKLVGAPGMLTDAGTVMGTPHYMAPEQVEHPRDVDHRADIYSLGVVFYEMLTGELPLGRFAPPSKRVEVDVRLDQIVLRTLERERELRYQNAIEVRSDVEAVEEGKSAEPLDEEEEPSEEDALVFGLRIDLTQHAWGWFLILSAGWLIAAAAFNLGALSFGAISFAVLGGLFALVRARSGVEPPAQALRRWYQRVAGSLLVALGLAALFLAHIASFERGAWHYDSRFRGPADGLDLGWRANDVLLERVGAARKGSMSVVEIDSGSWLSNAYTLLRIHPLVDFAAAAVLFGLASYVIRGLGAGQVGAGLPEAARTLALWLGSLVPVHVLSFALRGSDQSPVAITASRECSGLADELAQAVYLRLVERGFTVNAEHHGRLVDSPSGADLARLVLLKAAPSSAFDRWRMTWSGPRRLEPNLFLRVTSDLPGDRAAIVVEGGFVQRQGPEEREWRAWIDELLADACADAGGA